MIDLEQNLVIRSPSQKDENDAYYSLRWQVLREPWGKNKGTEKDTLENSSIHRVVILNGHIIAGGRMHFIDNKTAQIRYMFVKKEFINKGIGTKILQALEKIALNKNYKTIILHARESSVSFYEKQEYKLIKKSHLLFNIIQHYKMQKDI